jgi:hypothetical protein
MWQRFGIVSPVFPYLTIDAPVTARNDRANFAQTRVRRVDLVLLLAFALGGAVYSGTTLSRLDDRFLTLPIGNDVWFEADMPSVAQAMLHRWSDQGRNARHPLFPIVTSLPAYASRTLGVGERGRLVIVAAASAAIWSALVFTLLRLVSASRVDACVFTLLAHVSAAGLFWLPAVETSVLGSATLLVPLALAAWDVRSRCGDVWLTTASAISLSATTTSWISGIATAAVARPARAALQITINALAAVVLVWGIQKTLIPLAPFFIEPLGGSRFLFNSLGGGPLPRARALLFHTVVMPAVQVVTDAKWGDVMSVQFAPLASSGAIGGLATVLWAALLAAGFVALTGRLFERHLRIALASTLVAQAAIAVCYGEETFLYGPYVAPLLIVCAAGASRAKHGRSVTMIAAALVVLLAVNNVRALSAATQFFASAPRHRVQPL